MTTIAYKDGVIAYDSRRSAGSLIVCDTQDKKHIIREGRDGSTEGSTEGSIILFASGAANDIENLVAHLRDNTTKLHTNNYASGLLVQDGVVYDIGVNNTDGVWKYVSSDPWADGSGREFALAAMDMGASAKKAVKQAIKRDANSGGKVNVFVVKENDDA